jgi:hypothetical protein
MYLPKVINKHLLKRQDRSSPRYVAWMGAVQERDKKTCRWPNCNCKDDIEVHHIKRYANQMHLRYDICNGICLCKAHHKAITGNEQYFEKFLYEIIINGNTKREKPLPGDS